MSKVCAFLQNFDGAQLTPQDFYNFTVAAAAADSAASVSTLNRITYAYIAPVIITIGVIGDVLTVATLTHPLLRRCSIIYTYLTLLAMTDLLTHFSVVPMILWLLDWRLCSPMSAFYYAHVGFPLANALMGASVWLVVFLTFSQYMAVCQPFYQGYLRKRRMCFMLFILSYVFSFCVYAPWSTKKSVYTVPRGLLKCSYVVCDRHKLEEWFWLYEWAREFLTRLLPFFLIAYFNVMILVTYRSTKLDRMRRLTQSRHKRGSTERSEQEEKRLFGLLFGIIIIFFLCTIPAAPLTIFVADRRSQNLTFQIFRAVTNLLEFTKFALNFYFYCLINPDIRKICLRIIQCRKLGRPARVKGQPVNPISIYTRSTKSTIRGANGGAGLGTTMPPTQLQSRRDSIRSRTSNRQLRRANTSESPRRGSMIAARTAGPVLPNLGSADDSFLSLPPQKKRSASATFLSAEPFVPTLLLQHSEATKRDSAPAAETRRDEPKTQLLTAVEDDDADTYAASTRYSIGDDDGGVVVLAHAESVKRAKRTSNQTGTQRREPNEADGTIVDICEPSQTASTDTSRRRTDRPSDLLDIDNFESSTVRAPEILSANTAALSEIAQIAEATAPKTKKDGGDGDGDNDSVQIWLPDPAAVSDKMHLFTKIVAKAQKSIGSSPVLFSGPTTMLSSSTRLHHQRDQEVHTLKKVAACAQPRAYSFGHQLRGKVNIGRGGHNSNTQNCSRSLREYRQRVSDGAISHTATADESDSNNNDKSRNASSNSAELAALLALVTHAKCASSCDTKDRFAAPSPVVKTINFDYAMISSDDATALALIAAKALRAMEERRSTASSRSSPFSSIFRRSGHGHMRTSGQRRGVATTPTADTTSMHSLTVGDAVHRTGFDRSSEVSLSHEDVRALALIAANALKTGAGERSLSANACHHLTAIAADANVAATISMSEQQRSVSNNASLRSSIHALEKLDERESRNTFSSFTTSNALSPNYQYSSSPPLTAKSTFSTVDFAGMKSPVQSSAPISPRDRRKCPSPLATHSSKTALILLEGEKSLTSSNSMDIPDEQRNSKYRKRPMKSRPHQINNDPDEDENYVNTTDDSQIRKSQIISAKSVEIPSSIVKSDVADVLDTPRPKSMETRQPTEACPESSELTTSNGSVVQSTKTHEPSREDSRRRLENARRNFITSTHNAAIVVDANTPGASAATGSSAIDERFRAAAAVVRRTAQQS